MLITRFFPIVDTCLRCEDIGGQIKLCDDAQMAIFGEFLRPVFSASRVQHVSDLHLKFALRPHHGVEVWQTSNMRRLRLGEEKQEEERRNHSAKYNGLPYSIGRPQ